MSIHHQPILVDEILEIFKPVNLNVFVDGTLGAGGHAEAILKAHPEITRYIGIDQDPDARELAAARLGPLGRGVEILPENFRALPSILASLQLNQVDGILLDLGVSSMQLDRPERGFSFREEGPLDMRMDTTQGITAADILNTWEERDLSCLFRDFGEEPRHRLAASAIVKARPLTTTSDLLRALETVMRKDPKKRIHPATLVFQALRIAVNGELDAVREVIPEALRALRKGGRMAVLTFHSLEDRIVKHAFQLAASDKLSTRGFGGVFLDKTPEIRILSRKPIVAGLEEQATNPRSRSAKLRVIEKTID